MPLRALMRVTDTCSTGTLGHSGAPGARRRPVAIASEASLSTGTQVEISKQSNPPKTSNSAIHSLVHQAARVPRLPQPFSPVSRCNLRREAQESAQRHFPFEFAPPFASKRVAQHRCLAGLSTPHAAPGGHAWHPRKGRFGPRGGQVAAAVRDGRENAPAVPGGFSMPPFARLASLAAAPARLRRGRGGRVGVGSAARGACGLGVCAFGAVQWACVGSPVGLVAALRCAESPVRLPWRRSHAAGAVPLLVRVARQRASEPRCDVLRNCR